MTEILVLCTWWEPDYWERDKTASYPRRSIKPVQHLKDKTPLPGIGVYIRGRGRNYTYQAPCFLIIKDISENEKGEPLFDFHFISRMEGLTSAEILREIPKKELFFIVSEKEGLKALQNFNIQPPPEWLNLLGKKAPLPTPSWLDWIGRYFREILQTISNNEYEDRIAEIFIALGFDVKQLGHIQEGEYPDGIAYSKDFAIVYDCKNRTNYTLNANDKRAIVKYVQHYKPRIEERKKIGRIHFAIIAHSYDKIKNISDIEKETSSKGFLLTSEDMLYLLYKKLSLGPAFLLADFEELISNKVIQIDDIKDVYRG
jgi:hypothetical protein